MSEVERHEMPNGFVIYYRDSDHAYWTGYDAAKGTCSGRTPGISTVSKNDGDTNNDPLLNWAVRLAYEGVANRAADELADPETTRRTLAWLNKGDSVEQALKDAGQLWHQVRDAKGKVGGLSHGVLETLARGAAPILRTGYDHAAADWWAKRQPEVLDSERVVYSAEHGFAGRFDLRVIPRGEVVGPHALPDLVGKRVLGDAKTSGFISNSFHVQAGGYELAARECGIGGSDIRVILQLREDGTWHEWEGHGEAGDFLAALDTYTRGKRISSKARKDWRDWKQATEAAA